MKKVLMFTMESCPYCKEAHRYMDELTQENPAYQGLEIEIIDEVLHRDIADRYDYWYVPTYYIDGTKVHEGALSKEIVKRVFDEAMGM